MNSRVSFGISLRSQIVTFVRENNGATTKEIKDTVGKESINQLSKLVETGQLIRVKRGYYKFNLVSVKV